MTRLAVLTSGGDAPGMNAALRGVVKLAAARGVEVLGVAQGYEGLVDGRLARLTVQEVDAIGSLGGTVLGSARSVRFRTPEGRAAAARALAGVEGLVVIGGNGSLAGAHALATEHGVRVVGMPASIDNDIGCTATAIGVDTALDTIVDACDRISDTARAHRRMFLVEVMGRQCGYLAMAGAVAAGADACLFREQGKDEERLVRELTEVMARGFAPDRDKKRVLVIKAEGVEIPTDTLVRRLQAVAPAGVEVRGAVLGHLVRGGRPSSQDRMVAVRLAAGAVGALVDGVGGVMAAWQPPGDVGTPTPDPSVRLVALATVLHETESLLDGTSPITRRRVRMMEAYEGVLPL